MRILLSDLVTPEPGQQNGDKEVVIIDVRRAHFYAKALRRIFVQMPTEDPRHEQCGGAPLPKGSSEEEKINALAPRSAGQSQLCDSAHTLRRWYNACRHERGQWSAGARPSDKEVARVIERIRGLLDSERAQRA